MLDAKHRQLASVAPAPALSLGKVVPQSGLETALQVANPTCASKIWPCIYATKESVDFEHTVPKFAPVLS